MPNSKLKERLTVDVNTGENLELADYAHLVCDSTICNEIISTTLQVVASAIDIPNKPISMSVYLVEAEEGHQLNLDYRGKDYATNVLSFESDIPPMIVAELEEFDLGELIVCLPVVIREAEEQKKTVQNHLTHLLIHGCLHLLGYDHELSDTITEEDADKMEQVEITVLQILGIANPYDDEMIKH